MQVSSNLESVPLQGDHCDDGLNLQARFFERMKRGKVGLITNEEGEEELEGTVSLQEAKDASQSGFPRHMS